MQLAETTKTNIHTIINCRAIHKKYYPNWSIKDDYGHLLSPEWGMVKHYYKKVSRSNRS